MSEREDYDPQPQTEMVRLHPAIVNVLEFFSYQHLQQFEMREISREFHDLAWKLARLAPDDSQTMAALHDLLRAKDCGVRAVMRTTAS